MQTINREHQMKKGCKVKTSGKGRTAKWLRVYTGTVTKIRGRRVFVIWQGAWFEDEVSIIEVQLIR